MRPGPMLLLALALSLGLHAALLALPHPAPRPVPAEADVDLEILRLPPSAPPGLPPAGQPAPLPLRPRASPRAQAPAEPASPAAPAQDPLPEAPAVADEGEVVAEDPAGGGEAPAQGVPGAGLATGSGPGDGGAGDDASLRALYLRRLQDAVQRAFVYPRRAQRDRLEGRVVVEVVLVGEGPPRRVRLARSSGHALLDRAALDTVRSVRFPAPPRGLPERERAVEIPLDYVLRAYESPGTRAAR